MTDILFGNNNRPVLKLLAKRSLKAQKNTIAVLAIMLATLLFTSLFTIAISLQTAMQESNMRTTGTSAHAGIKRLSWEEYERLSSDAGVKDSGYSIIIGNAVGDNFNKTPTELRYGDETYAELTFNNPDTGHLYRYLHALWHLGRRCGGLSSNDTIIQRIHGAGGSGHSWGNRRNDPSCGNWLC